MEQLIKATKLQPTNLKINLEKSNTLTQNDLDLINKFTLTPLNESNIYIFNVILCTNEIDRDFESFTKKSIEKLAHLFVGKTCILDHNPTAANQSARIFKTTVETTNELTKFNEPKIILKAKAYSIKCNALNEFITKVNGGILSEVSISCQIEKKICSICGKTFDGCCGHELGKSYNNKICYKQLLNPSDAYEWSFVSIPAQIDAQTTKNFDIYKNAEFLNNASIGQKQKLKLRQQVIKLGFLCGFEENGENQIVYNIIKKLNFEELEHIKNKFENMLKKSNFSNSLLPQHVNFKNNNQTSSTDLSCFLI